MKVLVIGGSGFIGAQVVRQLVEAGHSVASFQRSPTPAHPPDSVVIQGERQRLSEFTARFQSFAPQVVVDMIAYNAREARSTLETFRGLAQRSVVASSMDVYQAYGRFIRLEPGPPSPQGLSEDSPLRKTRFPYRAMARSPDELFHDYDKIPVEEVVMSDPRLPGTVLRLPGVFGPQDKQHRLADYLGRMDEGEDILLDDPRARWRWTRDYVENVAAAIVLATTLERAAGRIYNVGPSWAQSEEEWIRSIGQVAGWKGHLAILPSESVPEDPEAPYDWHHPLIADTRRIHEELGYQRRVPLPMALERTIAWERTQRPGRE
ncbi:MAG: NAD-dependent epimerase/dehydratase family protein [Cystobacter sp.]